MVVLGAIWLGCLLGFGFAYFMGSRINAARRAVPSRSNEFDPKVGDDVDANQVLVFGIVMIVVFATGLLAAPLLQWLAGGR